MIALLAVLFLATPPPAQPVAPPPIRAVALAPHFEGERTPALMARRVDEIAALGATHLQLVVQWGQRDVTSVAIGPYRWGTDDTEIRALIAHAKARGLEVFLFPVLRLEVIRPTEWRGLLRPTDRAAWWSAYRRFILHYATLAAETGVELLSVGSELGAMEHERARWGALIAAVRRRFPGRLTYSANWDHFTHVTFWSGLDLVGVNGYHPLVERGGGAPTEGALAASWAFVRDRLLQWRPAHKPLLLTEVGYPSVVGAARRPWHYAGDTPISLEAQRRAYAALHAAWAGQPGLAGICLWAWHGQGGPTDGGYTVRGKPAEAIVRGWFGAPAR